ncbi:bifunctional diaminohydroxyphosphoribosylaminopyrimidine deaminase/5-amino-6-(5-phosphoribosylamino)uracil reductase RibD [Sulfurivirga sp.]|uniref:bifunctional diaminohydroxyphosphoribosylaminopyrimidine deaminase/5-amino-6-(5-phosphoribosylamino)uracil reductase RibD n=1 Tax=Sulfurivirga sp. TaxID=2614236 RepID=UPI0025D1A676|nr:bifunctional diaminohydroxyphosphoribosylaminopyrimidine deaminase/5-amino-6-(5-phosphoribosylamino)uracil reductase RibD [Sulfurivirga sp.]
MSFSAEDARHMARALRLAERGLYSTRPNPAVGCVIVKDGEVVGEGWHARAGGPHAEVVALRQAGEHARDATVYVTLEPCSHFGRTPPCANALVEAGVARVVIAMMDPNPEVAGQGALVLRAHGIQVDVGLMSDEAMALNRGFIKAMTEGLPWVRLKLAASLDGRVAAANGESLWITGEAARQRGHLLRARHGAIITGVETVLKDDPSLNVRLPQALMERYGLDEALCHPLRVVVDSRLRTPPAARMLSLPGQTLIATTEAATKNAERVAALRQAGALLLPLPADKSGRVALEALLCWLAEEKQVRDALVEAGPTLSGAFIEAELVDELHWFSADVLLGHEGLGVLHLPGVQSMADRLPWRLLEARAVGADHYSVYGRG